MSLRKGPSAPNRRADMDPTLPDGHRALAEGYALGTLDAADRAAFEAHLRSGCSGCREALATASASLGDLTRSLARPPEPDLRRQVLDLAAAPPTPIDPAAYDWQEIAPGIRVHVMQGDPVRQMRACLVWAAPGASHAVHRHGGDEVILVLQGGLRDGRASYGPGDVCRSRAGSVHAEEAEPGADCFCYVVYYGELEYL
jgi:anti-sigma factor ChrR (cupin superfamily)